jgi:hypothetical protein
VATVAPLPGDFTKWANLAFWSASPPIYTFCGYNTIAKFKNGDRGICQILLRKLQQPTDCDSVATQSLRGARKGQRLRGDGTVAFES